MPCNRAGFTQAARNLLGVGATLIPEMKNTVARTAFVSSTSSPINVWPLASGLLILALLWFEVINHLKAEWSLNPQYAYGWTVPFVALYLIWRRWSDRPTAAPPTSRLWPTALIIFCALLFFPVRFVAEANPDWRLLSWALALIAVSVSILWIFLTGGWPWLRQFCFPVLFFLIAVPWPMHFEQVVTQNLMRAVTVINVSLLNVAGIPALQHGNVIEVGSGLIGIEEACSGVRSLQATLMISLFLGELYSFTIARRVFLVIAGGLLAFLCNVGRTALLVWMGAKNGAKSIEAWHDPAGLTILLVCLFGLWLLSLKMGPGANVGQISNLPITQLRNLESCATSWPLVASLALWFLLAEAGVQSWYRFHQNSVSSSRWAVSWPRSEHDYQPVPIAPESEALLRYNEGGGATWQTSDGRRWMMYFFRWLPGRTAALFVKIHRPDVCLPASGLTLERDNGIQLLAVNGVNLPIRSYRFDDHGAPLHVFYCYWDARSSYKNVAAAEEEDWTARGRLRAALRGFREVGAQMLELVVWGYEDDEAAHAALQRELGQIVARS
jgi:exosortase